MNLVDRLYKIYSDTMQGIDTFRKKPAQSFCRLQTAEHRQVLVADDCSMVSIFELHGHVTMIGADEFDRMVSTLYNGLAPFLGSDGHTLTMTMHYDPDSVDRTLHEAYLPSRNSAQAIGLKIETLLDDQEKKLKDFVSLESVYLAVWTHPQVLPPSEKKAARGRLKKRQASAPAGSYDSQNPTFIMNEVRDSHWSFVESVNEAFRASGCIIELLDAHRALWSLRYMVAPEFTNRRWRAYLPGDPIPTRFSDNRKPVTDLTRTSYPAIPKQLWPCDLLELSTKVIQVGDRLHWPMIMVEPPQHKTYFDDLFVRLSRKKVPYRITITLDGDGLASLRWKMQLATFTAWMHTQNTMFREAYKELEELHKQNIPITRFRVCIDTWVDVNTIRTGLTPEEELSRRVAEIRGCIQSWGYSSVSDTMGDPQLGFAASIPGMMPGNPAPVAGAPLNDAIAMLPITRPASPWAHGSMILRTPDGKLFPYSIGSSEQSAWIDLVFAPLGQGKSLQANAMNLFFVLQPGLEELPYLSIFDIGPSSNGLISLLHTLLPEDKKHWAVYRRLRMEPEFGINVFDTPLGCKRPLPAHKSFLRNFLTLLATPLGDSAAPDFAAGIASAAIEKAYNELHPDKSPEQFSPHADQNITELLDKLGVDHEKRDLCWWDVVDILFQNNFFDDAIRAQRFAVPQLKHVAIAARDADIESMYGKIQFHGESASGYFYRKLSEAMDWYPIINMVTQFDIGEARVASLDLDEVTPKGSGDAATRQSAVMFMLARHVLAGRFFLMPADVENENMPQQYRSYHARRIDMIRKQPKRISWDEFHRVSQNEAVAAQIVGDIESTTRESRKWGLSICLISQIFQDFPDSIIEVSTSQFLLGYGTQTEAKKIISRLGLGETAQEKLMKITTPGPQGAAMLCVFRTSSGQAVQLLYNTLSAKMLWALTTVNEDGSLRNKFIQEVGLDLGLTVLAKRFPGGGAKKYMEELRIRMGDLAEVKGISIEQTILNELKELAMKIDQ